MIRRLAGLAAFFAIPFVMITILVQSMFAEQAHIHQHYFPPVPPPPGLLEREKEFVSWADDYRVAIIKKSRQHKICFEFFKYVAGLAGLTAVSSLSLETPRWVSVVFGFVSTAALFLMAAGQHQRRYTLLHRQAVELQKLARDFALEVDAAVGSTQLRKQFKAYRDSVEEVKSRIGDQIFKINEKEPPRISVHRL